MVPNVGYLPIIGLVEMVHGLTGSRHHAHRLALHRKAHQIEEVAAFFDHCPAGVARETVPIADFFQKRKAMLFDRQHLDAAGLFMHPA